MVGDFVLREKLGRGGMGTVFLAHQVSLDRNAAVKVLHDEFAADESYIENFIREARAAANLNHPGIVQAYAVGEDEGLYYFAMEYVEGTTLKEVLLHSGRMVPERALDIVMTVAGALDFGWRNQQLVHRDIKPDNIMLTASGSVKLADLGLARWGADTAENTGEVHGTPQYISPEQLLGQPARISADIYSLGATFYHMLCGHFPYQGQDAVEIAEKHLLEPLTPLSEEVAGLPSALCQVIEVMMAKRPAHRYRDMEELLADLRLVADGETPRRAPAANSQTPIDLEVGLEAADLEPPPSQATPALKGNRPGGLKVKPKPKLKAAKDSGPVPETLEPADGETFPEDDGAAELPDEELPAEEEGEGASGSKPLLPLIAAAVAVLLAVGGGVYFLLSRGAGEEETIAAGPAETAVDELAAVRALQAGGASPDQVAAALGEYASGRSLGELGDGFWELAAPLLGEDLAAAREQAREAELTAWRAAHEKLAAAAAARQAEEDRRSAEEARRLAEETKRREEADRLAAAAAELAARKDQLRWAAVEKCRANDYREAAGLFAPLLRDPQPEVVAWAKEKIACIELAQQLFSRVQNSQRQLAGAQLPVPQSRKRWTVTFVGIKTIEAEMTVTVYEKGVGREETKKMSLALDEADEQIFFHLISYLAQADKTVDANHLRLEFGAFLISRAKYLDEARRQLAGLPGAEGVLAEIEFLAQKAEN
jgi:serine/threonine protein kinase